MKRYYSHYTFIYPDIYLKNSVVELDSERRLTTYFPFEKEIEKTEFHSGILLLLPNQKTLSQALLDEIVNGIPLHFSPTPHFVASTISYTVYNGYGDRLL